MAFTSWVVLSEEKHPFAAVIFWLLDHDKLGCLCLMRNGSLAETLGVRDMDALAPTAARTLNFEDHLDYWYYWLCEECSPPATWAVEYYLVHIIALCFPYHQAPRGSWSSAHLLSRLPWCSQMRRGGTQPNIPPAHVLETAFDRSAPLWSCTGIKEEPVRGRMPLYEAAVPYQSPFCCLLFLWRGQCGWEWELWAFPVAHICGELVRRELKCGQATLVSFTLAGRSS